MAGKKTSYFINLSLQDRIKLKQIINNFRGGGEKNYITWENSNGQRWRRQIGKPNLVHKHMNFVKAPPNNVIDSPTTNFLADNWHSWTGYDPDDGDHGIFVHTGDPISPKNRRYITDLLTHAYWLRHDDLTYLDVIFGSHNNPGISKNLGGPCLLMQTHIWETAASTLLQDNGTFSSFGNYSGMNAIELEWSKMHRIENAWHNYMEAYEQRIKKNFGVRIIINQGSSRLKGETASGQLDCQNGWHEIMEHADGAYRETFLYDYGPNSFLPWNKPHPSYWDSFLLRILERTKWLIDNNKIVIYSDAQLRTGLSITNNSGISMTARVNGSRMEIVVGTNSCNWSFISDESTVLGLVDAINSWAASIPVGISASVANNNYYQENLPSEMLAHMPSAQTIANGSSYSFRLYQPPRDSVIASLACGYLAGPRIGSDFFINTQCRVQDDRPHDSDIFTFSDYIGNPVNMPEFSGPPDKWHQVPNHTGDIYYRKFEGGLVILNWENDASKTINIRDILEEDPNISSWYSLRNNKNMFLPGEIANWQESNQTTLPFRFGDILLYNKPEL